MPLAVQPTSRATMIRDINDYRWSHKLRRLTIHPELMTDAETWALDMAAKNRLIHGTIGGDLSVGWVSIGENVGVADPSNWPDMLRSFIKSPGHNANMLRSDYNRIGVGRAFNKPGTAMYVCVRFAKILLPKRK